MSLTLLAFPLKKEKKLFLKHYPELLENLNVQVESCGAGGEKFARRLEELIKNRTEQIDHVICLGSCGALDESLKIGDVIVANSCLDWESQKKIKIDTAKDFDQKFKALPHVISELVSVNRIVDSSIWAQEIKEKTGALAVAWEGFAGAKLCKDYELRFSEIRAVTDFCNSKSIEDFVSHLELAMQSLSVFLKNVT